MMKLTDLKIRRLKAGEKPYKVSDGGGLYLEVRKSGAKLWRYRYRLDGKENVFAVGQYPEVSLSRARAIRDEARQMVRQGVHPAHARQAERQKKIHESRNTFRAVAEDFAEQKSRKWSPRYAQQFDRAMKAHVYPYIGDLPIRSVTSMHILEIMQRMDKAGATTYALMVRQWCSAVFRYAAATMPGPTLTRLRPCVVR